MPKAPPREAMSSTPISNPSLTIDWELYAALLEESDMPLDQQRELIETLWSITLMFVDLGFDLCPVSEICGEPDDALSDDPPDLVSLINAQWKKTLNNEEAEWQA